MLQSADYDVRDDARRWSPRGVGCSSLPLSKYCTGSCRIPDDCIDKKRYPLFMARAVLKELIESLTSNPGAKPC